MPATQFESLTRSAVQDAVAALVQAEPNAQAENPSLRAIAILGFAGDEVRGTLAVAVSKAGLMRLTQEADADPSDRRARRDALGELSNLLLGDVKRAWSRRGVHVSLAIPYVLEGLELQVDEPHLGVGRGRALSESTAQGDRIVVWLDYETSGDVALLEVNAADPVAGPGDFISF